MIFCCNILIAKLLGIYSHQHPAGELEAVDKFRLKHEDELDGNTIVSDYLEQLGLLT